MPKLRVVAPDEKPAAHAPPKDLREAVERPERDLLVAMRRKVAAEVDAGVPAHALSSLMKQLRELDRDIRAMDAREREEDGKHGVVADQAFDASAI